MQNQKPLTKEQVEQQVRGVKQARKDGDALLQNYKALQPSREVSLAITKIQEATMWLGQELGRLGQEYPYPNSKDPSNLKIDPSADDLKN